MRNSRRTLAAVMAGALTIGLAACGGGGEEGGDGQGAVFNAATSAVVNQSDKTGGTLKYVHSDEPDSMDPGNTYYAHMWNFSRLYARPLLTFKQTPGQDGLTLEPDLAESLGQPSADGKTWTYRLKAGIRYEDGTPVTAKDVKYAIARSNYTDELTTGPHYFRDYLAAAGYQGPYKDKNLDNFKGIETPDDRTIVFKLAQPFAEFDFLVSNPQSAPVPQAKDTGLRYEEHPMSTGPYKFESHQVGKSFVLVKNTNWDPATDPHRKQLADRIEGQLKVDAQDIDNRLLSGAAHVDLAGTGVQAAARARILGDEALKNQADNPLAGFLRYAMMSTKVKPFDNIECRKAVQYAVDRVAVQAVWGGSFGGDIATTVIPPSVAGYKQAVTWQAGPDNRGDLNQAKQALAACGQPNGFQTNIAARGDRPRDVGTAEAIQASLAKVGITAQIKKYPAGDFIPQYAGRPDFVHRNNLGILILGWGADWPSGFGFLSQIVDGRAIKASGNYNLMELNDPEVNRLLDQGIQTTDAAARNDIWAQVDKRVMESAAMLPFLYEKTLLFRPQALTNVYVHRPYGMYNYAALGLG
jgi:peptide/nickel transport system substrate-binding protein